MHFMLDEEVDQWNEGAKESAGQVLSVLDGLRVGRRQGNAANSPGQSGNEITNHKDVVPIMVIGARDVCPSSTRQCPEDAHSGNEFGQGIPGTVREAVPQKHQGKSWSRADGNEDLKDASFRISVANGCGYGRKPFNGVAEVLVLHNFVVVQPDADDECA